MERFTVGGLSKTFPLTPPPTPSPPPPPPPINETHPKSPGTVAPTASPSSFSGVALGASLGFGGAIILVIAVCVVFWINMRRKRTLLGSCEAPLEKSKDDQSFGHLNQHWQQSAPSQAHYMVCRNPTPNCSPNTPYSKKHISAGVHTSLRCSTSSSSGSEKPIPHSLSNLGPKLPKRLFTYEELAMATDGFSSNNLLGEGGFGYVYKGILSNREEVAVKQLKKGSEQGEREFQSEVDTISHVHHENLVSLVGYCSTGDQRLLVYDYVPNKTLDFHLHGKIGEPPPSNWAPLNWATRMKVALGSAKGLAYLHEDSHPKIIHRDIKAANILLDNSFEAKVSDFGLARFTLDTDTHVSTRVIGTFGYIAPEYAQTGKLTFKSDVFSFGVVLLELITGRRPVAKDNGHFCKEDNIVDWARPLLAQAIYNAEFESLVDARLPKDYDFIEMSRMVTCAAVCVRHLARLRPRMREIVQALEGKIPLDVLNKSETISGGSVASSDFESCMHDTEMFKKLILENLENSSEWGGLNSDFTQQPSASSSECVRVNVK